MRKKSIVLAPALSGVFLFTLSARAHPPAMPAVGAPTSEIAKVYAQAGRELGALDAREPNINRRIAAYEKFSFSDDLKPRLVAIFGTDKPLAPERLADSKGRHQYRSVLKAGSHSEAQARLAWSEVTLNTDTNQAGNQMAYAGHVQSVSFGVDSPSQLSNLRIKGQQARAADGLLYGAITMGLDSLVIANPAGKSLLVDALQVTTNMQRRGKTTDVTYGMAAKSAGTHEHKIERLNIATRIQGIDSQALADFTRFAGSPQLQQLAPDAQTQVLLRKAREFGENVLKGGVTVIIDDISAAYRGQVASLKGRITLGKLTDAQFNSFPAIIGKLTAHLELRVPTLAVTEYARIAAGTALDPDAPDYRARLDAVSDQVLDQIRQSGFVKVEQGGLSTVVDFKGGVLTINGKAPSMFGMNNGKLALPDDTKPSR
jgi:uncharacterized protein YdgA (DUF945 family)